MTKETKVTHNQASRIEMMWKPVTAHELESFGGTVEASGVWTFRDGSQGKISGKPIAVHDDEYETVGFTFFERLDRVQ